MTDHRPRPAVRVGILADDLIWANRLAEAVRRSGGVPHPIRPVADLAPALAAMDGLVVDLTARAYDGVDALSKAHAAGVPAVAVGQHDDAELRRAARAAGAERVFAYRALHDHPDRELGAWISRLEASRAGDDPGAKDRR